MRNILRQLVAQLTADKKKLVIMILLAFFGLLLWGRLLIKQVPRTALAAPAAQVDASKQTTDNGEHADPMRQPVYIDLSTQMYRNIFTLNSEFFQPVANTEEVENDWEKSSSQDADKMVKPNNRALDPRQLTLDATMGTTAIINGKVCQMGHRFGGYKIVKVEQRYVVVERNGQRVKLTIGSR